MVICKTYLLLQANTTGGEAVGSAKLICPHCPKSVSFTCSSNFRRHLRLHSGERPYKCNHCAYTATRKQHLQSHLARRHHIITTSGKSHLYSVHSLDYPPPNLPPENVEQIHPATDFRPRFYLE